MTLNVSLQTKIVDYDYAVNDYYGNEQTKQEHVEPEKQIGYWSARMADGAMERVSYEAGPYGNLAHVIVRQEGGYAAPSYQVPQTYAAPSYRKKRSADYPAPAQMYNAPSYQTYAKVAPKMHYNYEEQNIYVAPTYATAAYAAPQTYAKLAPKMHYNYEEKNIYVPQTYVAPVQTYQTPQTYAASS